MKEAIEKAAPIIRTAQLSDIRLVAGSTWTKVRSPQQAGNIHIAVRHATQVVGPLANNAFTVLAKVEVRIVPAASKDDPKADPLVLVEGTYELIYAVPSGIEADQRTLTAFAAVNAVFHAWPYWREFVQSSLQRMSMPPIVLPVFRLANLQAAGPGQRAIGKTPERKKPARVASPRALHPTKA